MAHAHSHNDDTYYLDQLCLIGLSGAYAGICLSLYYWQTEMLQRLLADQFHIFVLLSGLALLGITLARAAVLWRASAKMQPAGNGHTHVHDHDHHHDHGPEACGHD